jgi:hypothetical protein
MALVVPVSEVAPLEEHVDAYGTGYFGYANPSYRSSRSAVSIGGTYANGGDYKVAAGFTAPIRHIQSGASIDYAQRNGDDPKVSVNAAISANVFEKMVYISIHNLWANKRDSENLFGASIGGATALYSNPYVAVIPLEFLFSTYIDKREVNRLEGTVRLTADFTPILIGRERTGQTATLSAGYTLAEYADGERENKIFASLGIVFMGKSSSAAAYGGYGKDDGKYGAFVYNSFRQNDSDVFADNELKTSLRYKETADGKILFNLECASGKVDSWVLRIDGPGNRNIRTFSGGNAIPTAILWDKTDSAGHPVKNTPARAKLVIKNRQNAVIESEWVLIGSDSDDN